MDWDTAVALAFASEQLFMAAQALTSDLVARGQGLSLAHARLDALLQNDEFLPARIRRRVRKLSHAYARNRGAEQDNATAGGALARQTMSVLAEIRDVLAGMDSGRPQAA